jgi:hypothetical protein
MHFHSLGYWVKNIIGLAIAVTGFWLFAFSSAEQFETNEILKKYHTYIGLALIPLATAIIAGISNLAKVMVGLVVSAVGLIAIVYFMPQRNTWMGQIMTMYIGPATVFGGALLMVIFDTHWGGRKRR